MKMATEKRRLFEYLGDDVTDREIFGAKTVEDDENVESGVEAVFCVGYHHESVLTLLLFDYFFSLSVKLNFTPMPRPYSGFVVELHLYCCTTGPCRWHLY